MVYLEDYRINNVNGNIIPLSERYAYNAGLYKSTGHGAAGFSADSPVGQNLIGCKEIQVVIKELEPCYRFRMTLNIFTWDEVTYIGGDPENGPDYQYYENLLKSARTGLDYEDRFPGGIESIYVYRFSLEGVPKEYYQNCWGVYGSYACYAPHGASYPSLREYYKYGTWGPRLDAQIF